jgi:hypothetical protein
VAGLKEPDEVPLDHLAARVARVRPARRSPSHPDGRGCRRYPPTRGSVPLPAVWSSVPWRHIPGSFQGRCWENTHRSYSLALLRWFRFLRAVGCRRTRRPRPRPVISRAGSRLPTANAAALADWGAAGSDGPEATSRGFAAATALHCESAQDVDADVALGRLLKVPGPGQSDPPHYRHGNTFHNRTITVRNHIAVVLGRAPQRPADSTGTARASKRVRQCPLGDPPSDTFTDRSSET